MLKRFTVLALCCVCAAPAIAEPASSNRWSGFYIGGHSGGGAGRLDGATQDLQGAVAGGHAGYNWQGANVVLGLEADYDWSDYELSVKTSLAGFKINATASHDFLTSARVRLGFADGPLMIYGTVGVAYTEIDVTLALSGPGVKSVDTQTVDLGGVIGGVGFEYALGSNFSLRGEALWFDVRPDFDFTDDGYDGYTVRGGLSYAFK